MDPALAAVLELAETMERGLADLREQVAELGRAAPVTGPEGPRGESVRGEKGEQGPAGKDSEVPGPAGKDGLGIKSVAIRDDGAVLVYMTDGTFQMAGTVVGKAGERGADGKDSTVPGPMGPKGADGVGIVNTKVLNGNLVVTLSDGTERVAGYVVGERGEKGMDGVGRDGRDATPATPGRDGAKGDPGRDGKDSITLEMFQKAVADAREEGIAELFKSIECDGRTLTIGGKSFALPVPSYKGVWHEGDEYIVGDFVSRGGSVWHCNATGTKDVPRDGQPGWTLAVKAGRDAKEPVKLNSGSAKLG